MGCPKGLSALTGVPPHSYLLTKYKQTNALMTYDGEVDLQWHHSMKTQHYTTKFTTICFCQIQLWWDNGFWTAEFHTELCGTVWNRKDSCPEGSSSVPCWPITIREHVWLGTWEHRGGSIGRMKDSCCMSLMELRVLKHKNMAYAAQEHMFNRWHMSRTMQLRHFPFESTWAHMEHFRPFSIIIGAPPSIIYANCKVLCMCLLKISDGSYEIYDWGRHPGSRRLHFDIELLKFGCFQETRRDVFRQKRLARTVSMVLQLLSINHAPKLWLKLDIIWHFVLLPDSHCWILYSYFIPYYVFVTFRVGAFFSSCLFMYAWSNNSIRTIIC